MAKQADGSPPLDDTSDLLQRAQQGDQASLNELFARHLPKLRRWASGRLPRWARDIADTTDVVHDTALETIKHLRRFEDRGDGAFQAYLRQAFMNRMRNELRKRATRGAPESLDSGVAADVTSPLELAIRNQTFERYEAALQALNPVEREAVVARLEFGLSYEQIAEGIGSPSANAARMTVVRSLAKVASAMRRAHA